MLVCVEALNRSTEESWDEGDAEDAENENNDQILHNYCY